MRSRRGSWLGPWSSGLMLWDRLHGTLKLDVPQDAITIGVPGYEERRDLTLGAILAMPFKPSAVIARRPSGRRGNLHRA